MNAYCTHIVNITSCVQGWTIPTCFNISEYVSGNYYITEILSLSRFSLNNVNLGTEIMNTRFEVFFFIFRIMDLFFSWFREYTITTSTMPIYFGLWLFTFFCQSWSLDGFVFYVICNFFLVLNSMCTMYLCYIIQ